MRSLLLSAALGVVSLGLLGLTSTGVQAYSPPGGVSFKHATRLPSPPPAVLARRSSSGPSSVPDPRSYYNPSYSDSYSPVYRSYYSTPYYYLIPYYPSGYGDFYYYEHYLR
jgi:hypothetical protein